MTEPVETQEQIKARLFISYKMAQHEIGRAIDILLQKNTSHTFEECVMASRMYAGSAVYIIQKECFDLENTVHENDRI